MPLFLSCHSLSFLALPVTSFLTTFVNFNILTLFACLKSFIFSLLKIMQWKELINQWGVRANAEKDLIRKLSTNTFCKMSNKNQLLIKLKCSYFFSFWAIMLSIADKCMSWSIGVFPPVTHSILPGDIHEQTKVSSWWRSDLAKFMCNVDVSYVHWVNKWKTISLGRWMTR